MGTFSINVSLQCQSRRNLSLSYSQVSQQSKYNLNYSHTNTPLNNTVITKKTDDLLIILNPYRQHFLTSDIAGTKIQCQDSVESARSLETKSRLIPKAHFLDLVARKRTW